jgi:hypothetical protein
MHLCFRLFVVSELQFEFEDDLGNRVSISAQRSGSQLHLQWSGGLPQGITFLVHQPAGVGSVVSDTEEWARSAEVGQLWPDSYAFRNAEVVIAVRRQSGNLVISE